MHKVLGTTQDGMIETTGGMVFNTTDEAQAFCDAKNAYLAAMNRIDQAAPQRQLSREQYEAAARALDLTPKSDTDCTGYGVRYGNYTAPEYPLQTCIEMALAYKRMCGIDAERAAARLATNAGVTCDYPTGRTLDCGHAIHYRHEVMSASRGTSCVDCYDRMSE